MVCVHAMNCSLLQTSWYIFPLRQLITAFSSHVLSIFTWRAARDFPSGVDKYACATALDSSIINTPQRKNGTPKVVSSRQISGVIFCRSSVVRIDAISARTRSSEACCSASRARASASFKSM